MRKLAFAILLLAACGRKPQGPTPLTITITHDGFVKFEGKAVTLDELGTLLATRRAAAPLEDIEGVKASPLPVLLDVEDDALWRHAMWVMTALAEQRFWRLSLPGGREAPLPVDSGICDDAPDAVALLVRVLVRVDGAYVVGDRTTRDIGEVGSWIDAAPRDGILCRVGQIAEQPRVTWRLVRPVFDLLRGRGVKQIDFDTAIPPMRDRVTSPLPSPAPSTMSVGWSGLRFVDYWSSTGNYEGRYGEEPEEGVPPEEELAAMLDAHRSGIALPAFGANEALRKAAALHAGEMCRLGYFGHFSPTPGSRSPSDRLAKLGWPEERRHAEMLAKGDTAEDAFAALLAKPENAAILADPAFKLAGVAQCGDCWVVLVGAEP